MEIISVTRGDHPSDPRRLSPSIKGMIPFGVTPLPTIASPIKGEGYIEGGWLLRAESATRPRARPPVINLCKLPQKVGAEMAPTVLDLRQQVGDYLFKYFLPSLI